MKTKLFKIRILSLRFFKLILFIAFFSLRFANVFGQVEKKLDEVPLQPTKAQTKADSSRNNGPKVISIDTDSDIGLTNNKEALEERYLRIEPPFEPLTLPNMLMEDTTWLDDGSDPNLVEVSEELNIDSFWVKISEYYSLWDTRKVNPYNIDPLKFKDTVIIVLYDSSRNYNTAFPIKRDENKVTSPYGLRGWRFHYGTDLRVNYGDTIVAAFDGVVRIKSFDRYGYGWYVMLRHYNGLETLYGHFQRALVKPGQFVRAGDPIGLGGSTGRSSGPHLHYEIRYQGNALNPESFYDFEAKKLLSSEFMLTPGAFKHIREARKVVWHRVRTGDTLGHIAIKYHTTITRICQMNGISRRTLLRVGQRLRVR